MIGVALYSTLGYFFLRGGSIFYGMANVYTTYGVYFTITNEGVWTLRFCDYMAHEASSSHGIMHDITPGVIWKILG